MIYDASGDPSYLVLASLPAERRLWELEAPAAKPWDEGPSLAALMTRLKANAAANEARE